MKPLTLNDQLKRPVQKKNAGEKDFIFMDSSSALHLWYAAQVTIDEIYDCAGHYLVTKSLGMESLLQCLLKITESLLQCLLKMLHSLIMLCPKEVPL